RRERTRWHALPCGKCFPLILNPQSNAKLRTRSSARVVAKMFSFFAKASNSPTMRVESRRPWYDLATTTQPSSTGYSSAETVARASANTLFRYSALGCFRAPVPTSWSSDARRNNRREALRIRCAKPSGLTAPPSTTSFSKSANAWAVQSEGKNIDEVSIVASSYFAFEWTAACAAILELRTNETGRYVHFHSIRRMTRRL